MALADWIRVFLLSLVWGCAFFLIEIALRDAGPFTIVLVRVALAAAALHLYAVVRRRTIAYTPRLIGSFLIMGFVASALPFSLIALGQTQIESGLSAILVAITPLFTVLVGHLWRRTEPATPTKLAGVVIGFAGVVLLMGVDALSGLAGSLLGQAAIVAASFSYALSALYGRRFSHLPVAATAASMLTTATLYMLPLAFMFETPFQPLPSTAGLAAMVSLALLSTAAAYVLYFRILANAGATNAMLVTFVQPPLAILLGTALLGESLQPHQLMGLFVILAGLLLVDGRVVRLAAGRA